MNLLLPEAVLLSWLLGIEMWWHRGSMAQSHELRVLNADSPAFLHVFRVDLCLPVGRVGACL